MTLPPRFATLTIRILAFGLGWLGVAWPLSANAAQTTVLFAGDLGTLPTAQGWPFFTNPLSGSHVTQQLVGPGVTLDTMAVATEQAGYFSRDPVFGIFKHPNMPVLNRTTGFSVEITLQVLQEQHAARDDNGDGQFDRGGFSIIALADDHAGLELAFWQDRIWAYEDDSRGPQHRFTQAEGTPLPLSAVTTLQLTVLAGQYYVTQDNVLVLQGDTRNYQFFSGSPDVYELPNFLFWGDDTGSAAAQVNVRQVTVHTGLRTSLCDLNLDGSVDASDMGIVFADWTASGSGDLNQDQITDAADAGLCFADWTGDTRMVPESMGISASAVAYAIVRRCRHRGSWR